MFDDVLSDDAGLGRGKLVYEDAVLEGACPEQFNVACEHNVPSEMYRPEVRKQPPRCKTIGHFTKYGGSGGKYGNACAIEPVRELRDPVASHVIGAERGPVQKASEYLQVRRSEAQRVQQRQTILCANRQRFRVSVGKEQQVAMRLADTL